MKEVDREKIVAVLRKISDAADELAGSASYAEIVGGISMNRESIRKYCDNVFEINREVDQLLEELDAA